MYMYKYMHIYVYEPTFKLFFFSGEPTAVNMMAY